jgi:flavin reductase (DIM6/NTAB) family NADH-FMN oxidoreductase RutF
MKPIKKLLNKLNGLHYPQEYLCFAKESFPDPLHVYLVTNKRIVKDITNQHLFVGYCPLVFAFSFADLPSSIQIIFTPQVLQPNEIFAAKDALASLELRMIKKQPVSDGNVFYYEATNGNHHFLSAFHQYINSINNQWYNKRPGNVFLHNNLYKQVQIAYSVPRKISLITVGSNGLFNLFPTDLHGQIDETNYIISLRTGGKACKQVEAAGKLLVSQMHCQAFKMVYGLGKNHMQDLKTKDNFPFSQSLSEEFNLPLPQQALSYKELELVDSFIHGIHTIMLFKIIICRQLQPENDTLAHIHNSYATWRFKNRLQGNYLLR